VKFSFGKLKASLHFRENDNRRISASQHLVGSNFAEPPNQFLNEPDFHRTIPDVRGQGKHAKQRGKIGRRISYKVALQIRPTYERKPKLEETTNS
jgi:hypothetical protein